MKKPTEPRYLKIRSYEFEYGILHLRRKEADSLSETQVIDKFGQGKGELIATWNDEMLIKYFNRLGEFTEQ